MMFHCKGERILVTYYMSLSRVETAYSDLAGLSLRTQTGSTLHLGRGRM